MTALSATIGTGNIAGVATAVVTGGPGAVFWMWITAIFGMATKYGEGVLAVKYRVTNSKGEMSGGPMYYIENGLGKKWKWLAFLFAFFGVMASFGIGSTVQANSVAQAVHSSFGIDTWITGVVLTLITAFVVLGGIQSISRVSSVVVAFMAVLYIVGTRGLCQRGRYGFGADCRRRRENRPSRASGLGVDDGYVFGHHHRLLDYRHRAGDGHIAKQRRCICRPRPGRCGTDDRHF